MSSILWEECELFQCLGALELHNRIVAMGLDGTTTGSNYCAAASPPPAPAEGSAENKTNTDSTNSALSPNRSGNTTNSNAAAGRDPLAPNPNRGTLQPPANNRLSRLIGGVGSKDSKERPVSATFQKDDGRDASPNPLQPDASGSSSHSDPMDALRKSVRNTVALATGSNNNTYYKYFLRSVLWRIYLRLLPFPYTGTARETIVEDWPTILFRCRAWYGGQRQQFLHCYPAHTYVAHDCAEFEPQNNMRTFSHFAEKAAAASDPLFAEDNSFGGSQSGASQDRKSMSLGSTLRSTFRGSAVMGNGTQTANFSQSYTNTSCLDGGPTAIKDDIITMDIKRTYVSADYEVPHHTLFMVLAMWRWQNPLVGYQQGMHEIAGNILLMLKRACEGVPRNTPPEVAQCANLAYVEADTYMLFDAFMNELGLAELFAASSAANQQNATPAKNGASSASSASSPRGGGGGGGVSGGASSDRMSSCASEAETPPTHELTTLEAVCHHIVFDLLKDHSLSLFNHFANTNVLDQLLLFLPRWIRNMFTREMTRPQVFAVWDGILAVYYADVVAAAIAEQERDAAKKAMINASSGSGAKSMFQALRQSMRFGKSSDNSSFTSQDAGSQFTHYINASDGNRTLGSFSPPLTDVAYVGEKGSMSTNVSPVKMRKPGTRGGDGDDEIGDEGLTRSYNSAISLSVGAGAGMSTKRGIGRRVGGFLRTIAGVAVELLLYLEEDLLELPDDFSQLKRLTRTPLLPSTADAVGILLRATTIARTRPRGIVLKTINGQTSISSTCAPASTTIGNLAGKTNKRSTVSALHAAHNSRLTREELLEQQKSVALVIANTANRLRTMMAHHAPPDTSGDGREGVPPYGGDYSSVSSSSPNSHSKKPPAPKSFTISAEEVGQLQGVLLELEHLIDKLV